MADFFIQRPESLPLIVILPGFSLLKTLPNFQHQPACPEFQDGFIHAGKGPEFFGFIGTRLFRRLVLGIFKGRELFPDFETGYQRIQIRQPGLMSGNNLIFFAQRACHSRLLAVRVLVQRHQFDLPTPGLRAFLTRLSNRPRPVFSSQIRI